MSVHGFEIDMSKSFICTRGNSEKVFTSYEAASQFLSNHWGYTLTYFTKKPA